MWMWSKFACSQMQRMDFDPSQAFLIAQNVKTTHKNLASRHRYWKRERMRRKKKRRTSPVAMLAHNRNSKPIYIYLNLAEWSIRHVRCVRVSLPKQWNWFFFYQKANFNELNSMKNLVSPFHLATRWLCDLCAAVAAANLFFILSNAKSIYDIYYKYTHKIFRLILSSGNHMRI